MHSAVTVFMLLAKKTDMPLTEDIRKQIESFVRQKPRNIQEISEKIGKSWKTADRYVEELSTKEGNIAIRKFREGSRGSLKIVYWNGRSQVFSSSFKEYLFNQIENGNDFSPFDIYQCVDESQRDAFIETQKSENAEVKHDLKQQFQQAEDEILIFSRNLSWATLNQNGTLFTDIFKELAEDGVDIKFIGRVDLSSLKNAEKLLNLNKEVGREAIKIKHSRQPVRGFIVDRKFAQLTEARELEEEYVNQKEDDKTTYVFYYIKDKEWVKWLRNCFWSINRTALSGTDRVDDLKTIKNLSEV